MFREKTVMVTGACGGIGRTAVRVFAERNADVWAFGHTQNEVFEQEMRELAAECAVSIIPRYFDMRETSDMKKEIQSMKREGARIDVLVNCAGVIAHNASFAMTTRSQLQDAIDVNLLRQIELTQYVLRLMPDGGAIVNLSSIAATEGMEGQYGYAISKAGVEVWTKMLARELGPRGIRVNAVSPSFVDTQMGNSASAEVLQKVIGRSVLTRMAESREVAEAIAFLASDDASFITGTILDVNGGRV